MAEGQGARTKGNREQGRGQRAEDRQPAHGEFKKSTVREYFESIVIAVILALFVRTFVVQAFKIPTGSMENNLLIGDHLLVNKFVFGPAPTAIERALLPVKDIRRGDIVVFKYPEDPDRDFIKRIIGLPGDKIQMKDGILNINGQPVKRERVAPYFYEENTRAETYTQYIETLPNGYRHNILEISDDQEFDNTGVFNVPPGTYFMMGDNRDNSADSRDPQSGVGYVPAENIVGRAEFIFFSTDGSARLWEFWGWPFAIRYTRLFHGVH